MDSRHDQGGHGQFEDMALSHVMGGLPDADGRIFRSHLLECPLCRDKVGELRAIAHQLENAERDERRNTAAKRTETKQRPQQELEAEQEDDPPTLSRRTAAVLGLFVVVLALLAGWNFVLRAQVNDLQRALEARLDASAALELGEAWTVTEATGSVRGEVREHDGALVVVAEGLTERLYGLYLLDTEGNARYREALVPEDGRIFPLIPADKVTADVVRLEIVRTDSLTASLQGNPVFRAVDEHPAGAEG